MELVERMVVSGFPTPKPNLVPTRAVPKSLLLKGASPSTKPVPLYHWPVPLVCVDFTQKARLKSLPTGLAICTELFTPLNARQPLIRPPPLQLAPVSDPLLLLPEASV